MEFRSTLEREKERLTTDAKRMEDIDIEVSPLVLTVNKLIRNSPKFSFTFNQAINTVKTIQPSITEEDCRIAVCLELTLCSELIINLIEDGLLEIKEAKNDYY
jgi:hypothetical protein